MNKGTGKPKVLSRRAKFAVAGASMVVLVVAVLSVSIWFHYQQAGSGHGVATNARQPQGTAYLDIKEWGVKLPLSSNIMDAYYVVSNSSYDPASGAPNTIWVSLTSLTNSGCNASLANHGLDTQLGAIVRGLPSDTDPIDGTPFRELFPGGVMVGKYYYAYSSWTSKRTCAPQARLQSIDTAFSAAVRGAVADSTP